MTDLVFWLRILVAPTENSVWLIIQRLMSLEQISILPYYLPFRTRKGGQIEYLLDNHGSLQGDI